MRRPLLGLALLVGCLVTTAQSGSTASSEVQGSTAAFRDTVVTGATLTEMAYTVTGTTITEVKPRLRGTNLLTRSVTARFGSSAAAPCSAGLLSVLNALTGLGEATYTCVVVAESASRPRTLRITVS